MREAPMFQFQPNKRSVKIKKCARHSKCQENEWGGGVGGVRVRTPSPHGALKNERDFLKLVSACSLNITYQPGRYFENLPSLPSSPSSSFFSLSSPVQYKRRMVLISKTSSPPRRVQEVDLQTVLAELIAVRDTNQSLGRFLRRAGIKSTPSTNKQTNKQTYSYAPYLFINVLDCTLPPRLPPFFCRRFNKLTETLSAPGCRFISPLPTNLSLGKWKCMC